MAARRSLFRGITARVPSLQKVVWPLIIGVCLQLGLSAITAKKIDLGHKPSSLRKDLPDEGRNVAFYITGHGLGHASRSVQVIKALRARGFNVTVVSVAPQAFFDTEIPEVPVRRIEIDSGAHQAGPLEVDVLKSLENYHEKIHKNRVAIIHREAQWLEANSISIVIGDAAPLAFRAAKAARAPCLAVCVSNFTWDTVYTAMLADLKARLAGPGGAALARGMAVPLADLEAMVAACAEDHEALDLMALLPGEGPVPGAAGGGGGGGGRGGGGGGGTVRVVRCPLLVRPLVEPRAAVRARYGFGPREKVLLVHFGGHASAWAPRDALLPPGWRGLLLGAALPARGASRWVAAGPGAYSPDLAAAADACLGKLGYGTVAEAAQAGAPLVHVPRSGWPEEAWLARYLAGLGPGAGVPLSRAAFEAGDWAPALAAAAAAAGKEAVGAAARPQLEDGGGRRACEVVAGLVAELAAAEGGRRAPF